MTMQSPEKPSAAPVRKPLNLVQAINEAMREELLRDPNVLVFGEDVAFGGVFRCSMVSNNTRKIKICFFAESH